MQSWLIVLRCEFSVLQIGSFQGVESFSREVNLVFLLCTSEMTKTVTLDDGEVDRRPEAADSGGWAFRTKENKEEAKQQRNVVWDLIKQIGQKLTKVHRCSVLFVLATLNLKYAEVC